MAKTDPVRTDTDMPWRGIFVILVTAFQEDSSLDAESLRRQVDHCIDAGVQGVVGPANASEFGTMSDAEREDWIRIVADACAGRVPFVAATSGLSAKVAGDFSVWAIEQGADGIMAMPPYILHPDAEGCYSYYARLNDQVSKPIVIQNYMGPVGTPMSAELVGRMCRELEWIQYVKEETFPEPRQISAALAATGTDCQGVFGGQGGVYIMDEFRRGACGNMPASQLSAQHVRLWQLLETGDWAGARALYNRILPVIAFERLHGVAAYKEILYRRGVFSTTCSRQPGATLDEHDLAELNEILALADPDLAR